MITISYPRSTIITIISFVCTFSRVIIIITALTWLIQCQVNRTVKRSGYIYYFVVVGLIAGSVFGSNSEMIFCTMRQIINGNLALAFSKVSIYTIECINYMVTIDTHIIGSCDIYNSLVVWTTFETCACHYRLLGIRYRHVLCSEYANLFQTKEVSRFSQRVNTYITCVDAYFIKLLAIDTDTGYRSNLFPCSIICFLFLGRSVHTCKYFVTSRGRITPNYINSGQWIGITQIYIPPFFRNWLVCVCYPSSIIITVISFVKTFARVVVIVTTLSSLVQRQVSTRNTVQRNTLLNRAGLSSDSSSTCFSKRKYIACKVTCGCRTNLVWDFCINRHSHLVETLSSQSNTFANQCKRAGCRQTNLRQYFFFCTNTAVSINKRECRPCVTIFTGSIFNNLILNINLRARFWSVCRIGQSKSQCLLTLDITRVGKVCGYRITSFTDFNLSVCNTISAEIGSIRCAAKCLRDSNIDITFCCRLPCELSQCITATHFLTAILGSNCRSRTRSKFAKIHISQRALPTTTPIRITPLNSKRSGSIRVSERYG